MAAAILNDVDDAEVSLKKGSGGQFDVHADDKLVFSKKELGLTSLDDVTEEGVIAAINEYLVVEDVLKELPFEIAREDEARMQEVD